ncbi:hypothetical protein ACLKA6_017325 [Drosophila palustris]
MVVIEVTCAVLAIKHLRSSSHAARTLRRTPRPQVEVALGSEISVDNLVLIILQSPENWDAISVFAASVLVVLRATERERTAQTVEATLLPLRSNAPVAVP